MKIIVIFCLFVALTLSQSTINIYNGGNCHSDCNTPSTPSPSPRKYRFAVIANEGDLSFQFQTTYFQRVLNRVPSLQGRSEIVPVIVSNYTQDVLLKVVSGEFDAAFSDSGITQYRLGLGLKFTNYAYYSSSNSYISFLVNLPLSGSANPNCDNSCLNAGVCGGLTLQDIATQATTRNVPINLRYDSGTYRVEVANDLKQQLVALGFAGTVNIYSFDYNTDQTTYVRNTSPSTAIEVVYALHGDTVCPAINGSTSSISVATFKTIQPKIAFPVSPLRPELLDLINFGIEQYTSSATPLCDDLIDYNYYCKNSPVINPEDATNDICYNYPSAKVCG